MCLSNERKHINFVMLGLMDLIFNLFMKKRQKLSTVEFMQTLLYIAYVFFLSLTVGNAVNMFVLPAYIISQIWHDGR